MVKILIVEDDRELNKQLCDYFKVNDYQSCGVFDGVEALKKIEEDKIRKAEIEDSIKTIKRNEELKKQDI